MTFSPYLSLGSIYGSQRSPNTMLIRRTLLAKQTWNLNLDK